MKDSKILIYCSLLIGTLFTFLYIAKKVSFTGDILDYLLTLFTFLIQGSFAIYFPCMLIIQSTDERQLAIWPLIMFSSYVFVSIFLFKEILYE